MAEERKLASAATTDQRVAFLRQVPLFKEMLLKELAVIAFRCRQRSYPQGALILSEGAPGGKGLFMIMKGLVNITKRSRGGGSKQLAVLKDFDFFGEMSLVDMSPVSATLYAADECEILVLDRAAFDQLIQEDAVVGVQLLLVVSQVLAHRLRDFEQKELQRNERESSPLD